MEEECEIDLPAYVALKATQGDAPFKHLGVDDDGKLAYTCDKVVNDRAKFAVEYVGPALAHIRSCYNNKYWVRSSESENWIVATAKEPIENKLVWNCTLFKTNLSDDGETVTFDHVQLEKRVGIQNNNLCLDVSATVTATNTTTTTTTSVISTVVDYESLVTLPRYVAFQHPEEGFLLSTFTSDTNYFYPIFSIFKENQDMGSNYNIYEVFTNDNGHISLKSKKDDLAVKNKYWAVNAFPPHEASKYTANIVGYKDGNPSNDNDMLFSVIKAGNNKEKGDKSKKNIVALRHLGTNKLLQRQGGGYYINRMGSVLTATSDTMLEGTKMVVVEPVIKREIKVIKFHTERARVYDRNPLTLAEGGATNMSSDLEQEFTLQLAYTKTSSSTWSTTNSWNINASVSLESEIPLIGGISITMGGGYSEEYQWGETIEKSEQVSSSYAVKVPRSKKVIVTAIATRGKCDVPFTYKQIDRMADGTIKKTTKIDGLYTGVNSYHFDYIVNIQSVDSTA